MNQAIQDRIIKIKASLGTGQVNELTKEVPRGITQIYVPMHNPLNMEELMNRIPQGGSVQLVLDMCEDNGDIENIVKHAMQRTKSVEAIAIVRGA